MKKNLIRSAVLTGSLLMIPALAMRFTGEVAWDHTDFIVMGTMIFVNSFMVQLLMGKLGKYRVPAVLTILFLFLWLWAELAVGVFTNWGS